MEKSSQKIVMRSYSVKGGKVLQAEAAREALMAAVRAIPLDRLTNVRTGQITIVQ